jgi:hypothetical protein
MGPDMTASADTACPTCDRRTGDHTIDEWMTCLDQPAFHLPFEPVAGTRPVTFSLAGRDMVIADTIDIRALIADGPARIPVLLLTFSVGNPTAPPTQVCEVGFIAGPDGMRRFGKLVRDSAYGAAKAGE